jgi:ElaB/YqjD/DUF883 family membrane-anchored ribosome-binding protein
MASSSGSGTPAKAEVDINKLADDMAVLKTDIAALATTLKELAAERRDVVVAEGRRRVSAVQSEAQDQLDYLQRRAEELGDQARTSVQERPGTALLIAAAVGMMFGFLTARK